MQFKVIEIENGDMMVPYFIYTCARCGEDVEEAWPSVRGSNGDVYCWECAFISGLISSDQYVKRCGIGLPGLRAAYHERSIHLTQSKYFPWERPSTKRNDKGYSDWRTSVFERDGYTCRHCGRVGGVLNAHHIKAYKTYKDLRLDVENGITLCKECHKSEHMKRSRDEGSCTPWQKEE